MGAKIAIGFLVLYVLVAVGVSFCFRDDLYEQGHPAASQTENSAHADNLHELGHPPSATIRNLVLIWGAPLATVLAVWRSIVAQQQAKAAQRQAEIAQGGLLSNRYQRAVEMLGHDFVSIRIGGIYALQDIALEHPDEYKRAVGQLLLAYTHGPKTDSDMDPAAKWELEAVRREALFVLEILKIPSLEEQALARLRKKKAAEQS